MHAFSANSGKLLDVYDTAAAGVFDPTFSDGVLYVVTSESPRSRPLLHLPVHRLLLRGDLAKQHARSRPRAASTEPSSLLNHSTTAAPPQHRNTTAPQHTQHYSNAAPRDHSTAANTAPRHHANATP